MDITEQTPVVTGLEKPFVMGLDLGGTNAVFGVVDQRGQVLATNSIKTQAYKTVDDFVEAGVEALRPLIAKYGGISQKNPNGEQSPLCGHCQRAGSKALWIKDFGAGDPFKRLKYHPFCGPVPESLFL